MRERYFWIAIILAVIIWTGNYTYLQSKQLDEPIFIKHYYEVSVEDRMPLEFYYLTNKGDHGTVNSISINGIHLYTSHDGFMFNQEGPLNKEEYIHHHLRSFKVDMYEEQLPVKKGSGNQWTFSEIIPSFSARADLNHAVDIGQVKISGEPNREQPFKFQMSGSSSEHRSNFELSAQEGLLIEKVEIPLQEDYPGLLEVKINAPQIEPAPVKKDLDDNYGDLNRPWNNVIGTALPDIEFPIKIAKGDLVSFYAQINDDNTMYLRFNIWIKGKSLDGEAFELSLPIWDEPYLNQADINDIITNHQGGKVR
ncbi:hypothetical protein ACTWQL_15195 [Pseudalkalibacillus sp. R45]|uniref:hypothetical protein n=1 Tax=Pseudalkalibacillus sp. R45 TaxID=3457433 RepID=UPI003FCE8566